MIHHQLVFTQQALGPWEETWQRQSSYLTHGPRTTRAGLASTPLYFTTTSTSRCAVFWWLIPDKRGGVGGGRGVGVSLTSEQGPPSSLRAMFGLSAWSSSSWLNRLVQSQRVNANRRKSLKRDLDISIKVCLVNRGLQIKTLLSPSF